MPHDYALAITKKVTIIDVFATLKECEKLKENSLIRGECKHIFGNYGQLSAHYVYLSWSPGVKEWFRSFELQFLHAEFAKKAMEYINEVNAES